MSTKLVVEVQSGAVQALLARLQKSVEDLTPAMALVGQTLVQRVRMSFVRGRSPWGQQWAPLKMRDGQPLVDTGRLRDSVVYAAQAKSVTVGTNVQYARTHQFGARIAPKTAKALRFRNQKAGAWVFARAVTVPPRPFFPITKGGGAELPPAWAEAVKGALRAHLKKQAGA